MRGALQRNRIGLLAALLRAMRSDKRSLLSGAVAATLVVAAFGCTGPNQQRNPLGLGMHDGRVELLIASCRNDYSILESVRLVEVVGNERIDEKGEGDDREIWSISSPDPVPLEGGIALGSVPPGFTGTSVPIRLRSGVTYRLDIKSKAYLYLQFAGRSLAEGEIYTDNGTFESRSAWMRSVRSDLC